MQYTVGVAGQDDLASEVGQDIESKNNQVVPDDEGTNTFVPKKGTIGSWHVPGSV